MAILKDINNKNDTKYFYCWVFMFHNKSLLIKLFFPIVICYAFIGWHGLLDTGWLFIIWLLKFKMYVVTFAINHF